MTFDYSDKGKEPLVIDMEGMTLDNENYRTTLWTGDKIQLTVMSIQPGDDIGRDIWQCTNEFLSRDVATARLTLLFVVRQALEAVVIQCIH